MKALKIIVITALLCIAGWNAIVRIGHAMFPEVTETQEIEAGRAGLLDEAAKAHEHEYFERQKGM